MFMPEKLVSKVVFPVGLEELLKELAETGEECKRREKVSGKDGENT